jgi:hypothetical protein
MPKAGGFPETTLTPTTAAAVVEVSVRMPDVEGVVNIGGSGLQEPAPRVTSGGTGSEHQEFTDLMPAPYLRRATLFGEAQQLATLPRGGFEWLAAPLWAAIASMPGSYQGLMDLLAAQPKSKVFDLVEMAVTVIAATILVFGFMSTRGAKTADKYLKELFGRESD